MIQRIYDRVVEWVLLHLPVPDCVGEWLDRWTGGEEEMKE